MGAGTIIVLIAVLIVAATTAGVLLNVTDSLQSEAGVTGESVSAEVESPVRIAAVTGRVNQTATPPVLDQARIILSLDGSSPVDLDEAAVRIEAAGSQDKLVYNAEGSQEGTHYGIDPVVDPDDSAPTLTDLDDRFAVVVDTPPLTGGELVLIHIALETGASKTVRFRVPDRIASADAVTVQ